MSCSEPQALKIDDPFAFAKIASIRTTPDYPFRHSTTSIPREIVRNRAKVCESGIVLYDDVSLPYDAFLVASSSKVSLPSQATETLKTRGSTLGEHATANQSIRRAAYIARLAWTDGLEVRSAFLPM